MIDKNERKKKYLLQYGSLLILHVVIIAIFKWAVRLEDMPEWAIRLMYIPGYVPFETALYITFRNERVPKLIRDWCRRIFAMVIILLVVMQTGIGSITIR